MFKRLRVIPSYYFGSLVLLAGFAGCGGSGGNGDSDQGPIARPPTVTLTSTAETIELGGSFTLNWSVVSSTACEASVGWDGNKESSGAQSITPTSVGTYRYVLTCSNVDGSTLKDVSVEVIDTDTLFRVKVIDGYIDGANVFVDFNWNLRQDEGEPSAVNDGEGNYSFPKNAGEFAAINEASFECARNRIQVAEVPIGAIDQDRGLVEEAFTMFYIPGGLPLSSGNSEALPGEGINISPFTGLFLDIVAEEKTRLGIEAIELADGCASEANLLAEGIISSVKSFVQSLESDYAITLAALYEDYLTSNNAERAAKAEKIVNFLKAADGIKQSIITRHSSNLPEGYRPYVGLSKAASDRLFGSQEIKLLEVSVGLYFDGQPDSENWYPSEILQATELKLLENGQIVDFACSLDGLESCTTLEPDYENIINSLKSYVGYSGFKNETLLSGVTVTSQIREEIDSSASDSVRCDSVAQLIYDEPLAVCEAIGCPSKAEYQVQINHNLGFSYPDRCDQINESFLYAFIDEKHQWAQPNSDGNSREILSVQYSLNLNSEVYPSPPVDFLGDQVKEIDHQNVYEFIKTLFVEMDETAIAVYALLLKENEFLNLARTTFDGGGSEKERFDYMVTDSATSCREQTWNSEEGWSVKALTEGAAAFAACAEFISDFSP